MLKRDNLCDEMRALRLQSHPKVEFYAYIFVANVLAIVIVARWVKPFGSMASQAFSFVFAYLTIVTCRWLFGRREL